MKLGDFFSAAPYARPVNPRPVTFTSVPKSKVMPGENNINHTGVQVAGRVTAGMVFIGGTASLEARVAAKKALREMFVDTIQGKKVYLPIDPEEFEIQLVYELLARILHEWNPEEQTVGDRIYPNTAILREHVEVKEAQRVFDEWAKYMDDEHKIEISEESKQGEEAAMEPETFRGAQGPGTRVAAVASH